MNFKANERIRRECYENHVPLWKIADAYGKSYSWIIQKLRHELSADEQEQMIVVIHELGERKEH